MFFKFEAEKECIARLDNHTLALELDRYKKYHFHFGFGLFHLCFFSPFILWGLEQLFFFSPISHILPKQIQALIASFLIYQMFKYGRLYKYAMTELKSRI